MTRRKHLTTAMEDGPDDKGPLRRCIVGGGTFPKESMIRFVVAPDGTLAPDVAGRLPGRGFWLRADRDVINKALVGKSFAKASRSAVEVPDDLVRRLEDLLARRCLDLIGLARRAGRLAAGFEKVQAALREEPKGVLIVASDAAAGGRAKVQALALQARAPAQGQARAPGLVTIDPFTAAELGGAVGRDAIVHMAVEPGRLADALIAEAGRLAGVRRQDRRDAA